MTRTAATRTTSLAAILAGMLALFLTLTAGAQVVGGTLSGTITDTTGAALPNATVLVHNDETGNERRLLTGPDGRYAAPSIPVGTYTITAEAPGFTEQHRTDIPLTVGESKQIDLRLGVDSVTEQVTVVDSPAIVNLSTQQTSGLVDERQIKQLPLNGRSYDQLLTLNPATVNYTGQRSGNIGTSNSSVGNMFAVSGRRPQDNLFLLNGIEYTGASLINVTPGGTSGQLLGVDAVREFNVLADTYGANYGKRQGAQISIVTASGTNQIHGSVYEFLRNSALDARNYFDQPSQPNGARLPEFQRNNFGASLGGPIKKDKLLLFTNYEGYRQNLGLSDVTLVPDNASRAAAVASVKPLLALWPVQNGPELGGGIAEAFSSPMQHIREDFGTTRFDYNISPSDLFFAAYTIDDSIANTPTQNPLSLIDETLREQVLSAQEQHVFSAHLLNTVRVGFSRASFYFLGSTPVDVPGWVQGKPIGAIVIAGSTASNGLSQITGAGGNVGSNNSTTRNLFTVDDHIFWSRGRHQIEAGGWLQRLQSNDNLAQNQYGQASFATLATFLQGTVATFTVVPNPTELAWRSLMGASYIEDTVHITPRLEARLGLRVESTNGWNEDKGRAANYGFTNGIINTNPTIGTSALSNNRAKFLPQPRVGLSWAPFAS
ncbi:MAG: carboxypeptidase-like regulatory domain-containing protein, partial [Granulicella sp.]